MRHRLLAIICVGWVGIAGFPAQRVEGRAGVLSYSLLLGAAGNMLLTFYPATSWLIAAFNLPQEKTP